MPNHYHLLQLRNLRKEKYGLLGDRGDIWLHHQDPPVFISSSSSHSIDLSHRLQKPQRPIEHYIDKDQPEHRKEGDKSIYYAQDN